jgi:hypothetical protein
MLKLAALLACLFLTGCFPYVYHDQDRVLVKRIDVDATLEIARSELEEGGFDATLAVWAIRDQVVSEENARVIAELYSTYIDKVAAEENRTTADFGVWHFAWAISNLYRNGNDRVRKQLEAAYIDAQYRPQTMKKFRAIADAHVNGKKIVMGDIHGFARSFARSHIVAPGNKHYLQSLDEYRKNKDKKASM